MTAPHVDPESDPIENEPEADPESEGEEGGGEPQAAADPAEQLRAELAAEREARIRLEERLAAAAPKPAEQQAPKHYTHAQLRQAVLEGKIDEDQMVEIWSKQQRELAKRETEEMLNERERRAETSRVVNSEMDQYIASHPELEDKSSDTWRRVKREYDYLRSLGDPDGRTTELKALRAALGPAKRVPNTAARRRETPSDGGSAGGGGGSNRNVDVMNRIPHKYREYYRHKLEIGAITLKEIEKELPYMKRTA